MDKSAPSMLKATVIGGTAAGFVSALPVIGALNCLCCCLVIGGGFLAAYLYSRECERAGVEFRPGQGAWVGLVAGVFYAVAGAVVGVFVRLLMPPPDLAQIEELLDQADLPPEVVDSALQFMDQAGTATGMMIFFFINLLIAAVFSTIGGLIGGSVFKVASRTPPAAPPGAPPAPPV